jgi:hypothetical protein
VAIAAVALVLKKQRRPDHCSGDDHARGQDEDGWVDQHVVVLGRLPRILDFW